MSPHVVRSEASPSAAVRASEQRRAHLHSRERCAVRLGVRRNALRHALDESSALLCAPVPQQRRVHLEKIGRGRARRCKHRLRQRSRDVERNQLVERELHLRSASHLAGSEELEPRRASGASPRQPRGDRVLAQRRKPLPCELLDEALAASANEEGREANKRTEMSKQKNSEDNTTASGAAKR